MSQIPPPPRSSAAYTVGKIFGSKTNKFAFGCLGVSILFVCAMAILSFLFGGNGSKDAPSAAPDSSDQTSADTKSGATADSGSDTPKENSDVSKESDLGLKLSDVTTRVSALNGITPTFVHNPDGTQPFHIYKLPDCSVYIYGPDDSIESINCVVFFGGDDNRLQRGYETVSSVLQALGVNDSTSDIVAQLRAISGSEDNGTTDFGDKHVVSCSTKGYDGSFRTFVIDHLPAN